MEFYYNTMSYFYYAQMAEGKGQKQRTIHD